jgi:hypothetical protein
MHTAGFERLNKVCGVAATKDKARGVNMRLHGSAESLLRDHGERIGVVHDDKAVHSFTGGRMTDKLGHGLAHAVNAAILLG